jgi:hypothetical protein
VLAFIGTVLGGGAQLRTGVNPAGQAIQNMINQDIEAQKESINTKKSLLQDYYRQFGNLDQAHRATFIDMATMAKTQLDQIAASTQSEIVRQNAALQSKQLGMDRDMKVAELAQMSLQQEQQRALMGAVTQGGVPDEAISALPKEMQERAVRMPNGTWGFAIDAGEAKNLREIQPEVQTLRGIIKEMSAAKKKSGGEITNWIPFVESDAETVAKALQERAKQTFRNIMTRAGRPGEFTDRALERLIPNVSMMDQDEAKEKLKQFAATVESVMSNAYGSKMMSASPAQAREDYTSGL